MTDESNETQPFGDGAELFPAERRLVTALRAPVSASDGFDARVMTSVRREAAHGMTFLSRRRRSRFGAAAAAVAAAAVFGFRIVKGERETALQVEQEPHIAATAPISRTVRFTLVASGASQVSVAGSFNGWSTQATPLRRVGNNTWAADIPLGAGRYVYQFVIDGKRWMPDPRAPRDAGDDFGATNSVVTVATLGSA